MVADEVIITALMENGTVKEAAAAVNLKERAVYDRMNNNNFKVLYKAAKADVIRNAVYRINSRLGEAIDTVSEIMTNQAVNPAIRLQAAQTIFTNADKFTERLHESEQRVANQIESNEFDIDFFHR